MAKKLSGWGNYPSATGDIHSPRSTGDIREIISSSTSGLAPRGNARSYGDSSFNANGAVSSLQLDRMIAFDRDQGLFTCEAGALLGDVIDSVLHFGWFPPVTPGTKYVTIGGMVAADVHGKNGTRGGTFGRYIEWLDIIGPDGQTRRCSRAQNPNLFEMTIGGMGLTGFIIRVCFRLRAVETGWIRQTREVAKNLDELFGYFDNSEDATYRVAWIDVLQKGETLGRGLFDKGEHALLSELSIDRARHPFTINNKPKINLPLTPPLSPLNGLTLKAFNALYYRLGRRQVGSSIVDWDSFFYPLDAILNWNRFYGRRGFSQYQCVLPLTHSEHGIRALLQEISTAKTGSFLAVLKRLGPGFGMIPFAMDGYTLALDFPWNRQTSNLMDRLDRIVLEFSGRVYLAKDARLTAATYASMQDRRSDFVDQREQYRLNRKFSSLQSERLEL